MAEPTPQEQLMLELINEARLDPMGNAARYISSYATQATSNDPQINQALDFFNVNGPALKAALEALTPAQALGWNDDLSDAALKHSQEMIDQNKQSHQLPGEKNPFERMEDEGYSGLTDGGENIFYFSENPLHGHAGFMVDWGSGPNGMQPGAGHRTAIMNDDYREIGIGIVDRVNGMESTTQDFGNRSTLNGQVLITGVAYNDSDNNDFYSIGEGVVDMEIVVGADSEKSTASGGYTLQTGLTGTQIITFSGGGLAGSATYQAILEANNNYKLDIVDIGTANPVLRTSLSGVLTNSTILNITGIGTVGLELGGLAGNNIITGAKGGDTLNGGADNDTLSGGIGNDTMTGGTGADIYLYGMNFDADTIDDFNSGQGDKITLLSFGTIQSVADLFAKAIVTENGGDTKIDFGGGDSLTLKNVAKNTLVDGDFNFAPPTPIISGTAGKDIINATNTPAGELLPTDGEEIIFGFDNDDIIDALGGNDMVEGGAGNDKMAGGAGTDTLSYESAAAGVTVSLLVTAQQDTKGAGKDTVSQFENILGSAHADKLTGDNNTNLIDGGANDDVLDGGKGDDTLLGGNGDDLLIGGLGSDTIDGSAEGILGDTASFAGITVAVSASLAGGAASYKIGLITDTDTLLDIENLVGGSGADQLFGDGNDNKLDGAAGNDKLFGDAGNDTLIGGIGNDELQGDDGDDLFIGGAGADLMMGGANTDTVSYAKSTAGVTIELTGVAGKGGDAAGDVLGFVENVVGSAKDDKILGSVSKNTIEGGAGNDTIDGSGGIDTVDGGAGNDTLFGNDGADILIGGDGIDTASYAEFNLGVNVTVNGAGFQNNAEGDQLFGIENLIGTAVNDTLAGDGGVNSLTGGGGDDILSDVTAGDGIDVLLGGAGNDQITGHAGDKLDGGTGLDTLVTLAALVNFVTVDLSKNLYTEGKAKSTLVSFEHVTGSDAHDTLTGTAGINTIIGNNGNDVIEGLAGADILDGDGSNLPGSSDTVVYALSNAAVTIDLTQQGSKASANDAPSNAQIGGHAVGDKLYGFENVIGSKFADKLTGTAAIDNIIEGGLGNDIISGDTHGANGDTISFASATATVKFNLDAQSNVTAQKTGGAGDDIIFGFENILGGKGADILTGDAGKNTIDGRAGNDIIQGGAEADKLIGGLGIDTLSYAASPAQVLVNLAFQGTSDADGKTVSDGAPQDKGDAQGDLIWGFENLIGTVKNDSLFGDNGANKIEGGGDSDHISGRGGNDVLDGGADGDTVRYDYLTNAQHLTLTLGAVDAKFNVAATKTSGIAGDIDTVSNFENVLGGAGNDLITGNAGGNTLDGAAGDDRLSGMAGIDGLNGGTGNDILEGGLGDDFIDGQADNDTASYKAATIGVTVDLTLQGAQQNTVGAGLDQLDNIENLVGSGKNDKLTGDGNANIIEGGLGIDILEGGLGIDTLSYAGSTAAVTVSLAILVQQNTVGAGLDTATGFENLTGGAGADKLTGDSKDNVLSGGAGNDILVGGDGNDTYRTGAGADKITDGGLDGKGDIVFLSGADGVGDTYDLGADSNDAMEFQGTTAITLSKFSAASIENLNANGFDIVGTTAADNIDLSAFTSVNNLGTIDGLGGNDKITGSFAADTLLGGAGVDILDGKAGADHLHGGLGLDVLTGGLGADTFHIKWAEGADKITDFVSGVDEIELDLLPTHVVPTNFVQASGTGVPVFNGPGAAIVYDQDDGKVYYDTGPTSVHIATLTGAPTLALSDFTFV